MKSLTVFTQEASGGSTRDSTQGAASPRRRATSRAQLAFIQRLAYGTCFAQRRRKTRSGALGARGRWFESSRPDQFSSSG
jgi:hypothetical protein